MQQSINPDTIVVTDRGGGGGSWLSKSLGHVNTGLCRSAIHGFPQLCRSDNMVYERKC
jgi:hypothetical protein